MSSNLSRLLDFAGAFCMFVVLMIAIHYGAPVWIVFAILGLFAFLASLLVGRIRSDNILDPHVSEDTTSILWIGMGLVILAAIAFCVVVMSWVLA